MSHDGSNCFVLTGGPGSGKSTLIEALAAAGFRTAPEAGRAIIRDQVAIAGRALPWVDPLLFAEMMLARDLLPVVPAPTSISGTSERRPQDRRRARDMADRKLRRILWPKRPLIPSLPTRKRKRRRSRNSSMSILPHW